VPAQRTAAPNRTGLPNALKAGIEAVSGFSMDTTRVHYNSAEPAQLNAHAFARGTDIHIAPGQERHLPHEAWHVVQQAQGRVQPTAAVGGTAINDDAALEDEADAMGTRALQLAPVQRVEVATLGAEVTASDAPRQLRAAARPAVVQRSVGFEYELGNVQTYSKGVGDVRVALAKGQVLQNRGSFEVTADDPPTGSPPGSLSDLELRTPAPGIDDTVPGSRDTAAATLGAMAAYLGTLQATPHENAVGAEFVGAAGADRYDDGVLQATIGLSHGGLANLVSGRARISAEREGDLARQEKTALAGRWAVWDREGQNQALDERVRSAALRELYAVGVGGERLFASCRSLIDDLVLTPDEKDLLAAVMSRIIAIPVAARTSQLPYPKAAAGGLLGRSDFATIIAGLPAPVMNGFAGAADFKIRLLAAMRDVTGDNRWQLADPVFPNPIGGAPQITLTLDAWFGGLYTAGAHRVDLLTRTNYPGGIPADPERQQLESLGHLGNQTDPQAAGPTGRPIFELRNLGSVRVDDLVERGLAVWDLVQKVNQRTEA
jgi:hypothetical protein